MHSLTFASECFSCLQVMKVFALTMVVVIVVAVFGYMAGLVRLIGGRVLMHEEEFGVMCGQRCDKFQKNVVASVTDRQMLQTLTSECTPFNKEHCMQNSAWLHVHVGTLLMCSSKLL